MTAVIKNGLINTIYLHSSFLSYVRLNQGRRFKQSNICETFTAKNRIKTVNSVKERRKEEKCR
jgi:hypothetical protein